MRIHHIGTRAHPPFICPVGIATPYVFAFSTDRAGGSGNSTPARASFEPTSARVGGLAV